MRQSGEQAVSGIREEASLFCVVYSTLWGQPQKDICGCP